MAFVIEILNEKKLSDRFMRAVFDGCDALPTHSRIALEQKDFKLVIGKSIQSIHPDFLWGGFSFAGFFDPGLKSIFVGEFVREFSFSSCSSRWKPVSSRNVKHVLFHEIGHFTDLCLEGTGHFPHGYSSGASDFMAAHKQDVETLKSENYEGINRMCPAKSEFLKQWYQEYYSNYIQKPEEAYAEIWAQIHHSDRKLPIRDIFPASRKVIEDQIERRSHLMAINGPVVS